MFKVKSTYGIRLACIFIAVLFLACKQKDNYKGPPGYDFANPEKFIISNPLYEISGIAFVNNQADMFYAINDEIGKLYFFKPGDDKYSNIKFGKKGDYEDLCIFKDNKVVVLKSDGTIYMFPLADIKGDKIETVNIHAEILPPGEYEGMSWEENRLLVLCKNCPVDKKGNRVTVYSIDLENDSVPELAGTIVINLKSLQTGKKKIKFRPSCMAKNPVTNEWYIISSVNNLLLVLDADWKYKIHYPLNPVLFKQPEGIAFSKNGDLYVSNEGKMTSANILLFKYTAP